MGEQTGVRLESLQKNRAFLMCWRSTCRTGGPLTVVRPTGVYPLDFFCSSIEFYVLLSPCLCFISFLYLDLYVIRGDAWIS